MAARATLLFKIARLIPIRVDLPYVSTKHIKKVKVT